MEPSLFRTFALPDEVERRSVTTTHEQLVKIGAKLVWHARYFDEFHQSLNWPFRRVIPAIPAAFFKQC
jgi:hypothetical protein